MKDKRLKAVARAIGAGRWSRIEAPEGEHGSSIGQSDDESLAAAVLVVADDIMFSDENLKHAVLMLHLTGGKSVPEAEMLVDLVVSTLRGDAEKVLALLAVSMPVDEVTPEMIEACENFARRDDGDGKAT
jgi:hypothetical protein